MEISAVIITYNEERNIERCLSSLKGIAQEIIVVDSFSKDRTKEICESHGAIFIENPFEGHIQQKNFALSKANCEWVLSLDADEALDADLRASITELQPSDSTGAYRMNRLTNYCGHWVKHTGWYPDTKLRLVRNKQAEWRGENPHDRLELIDANGGVGFLKGDILHYSYYDRSDHLKQIEFFSGIAAKEAFVKGKKSSWLLIVVKVFAQFVKSFLIKRGFLDGATGFTISRLSAYATYRKYWKLKRLQQGHEI